MSKNIMIGFREVTRDTASPPGVMLRLSSILTTTLKTMPNRAMRDLYCWSYVSSRLHLRVPRGSPLSKNLDYILHRSWRCTLSPTCPLFSVSKYDLFGRAAHFCNKFYSCRMPWDALPIPLPALRDTQRISLLQLWMVLALAFFLLYLCRGIYNLEGVSRTLGRSSEGER